MNSPVALLLVAALLHTEPESIPFKYRPKTFLVAVKVQGLSEGREIFCDGNERLKSRCRRLIGRSVASLYHPREAEERPVCSSVQIWKNAGKMDLYRVQPIKK